MAVTLVRSVLVGADIAAMVLLGLAGLLWFRRHGAGGGTVRDSAVLPPECLAREPSAGPDSPPPTARSYPPRSP